MKQKMIYLVLLLAAMYLPASSRECGKVSKCTIGESAVPQPAKKISHEVMEEAALPVSPFGRLPFNL